AAAVLGVPGVWPRVALRGWARGRGRSRPLPCGPRHQRAVRARAVTERLRPPHNPKRARLLEEVRQRVAAGDHSLVILDVRERDACDAGHVPGARHLPGGQLELRVERDLPDPTAHVLACCELGKISTLAAGTLRAMGCPRAVALDGGFKAWREAGHPLAFT